MMIKFKLLALSALFLLVSGFDPVPVSRYEPVFMLRSEMEKGIRLEGPRDIRNPGKIYLKDDLIFINEKYMGIHVIDNTNPEEPDNFAFIRIDGCIDMAMKHQVLYADNAVDLVSLALSPQMTGIEVTSRNKDIFPELKAPDGRGLTTREQMARPDNAILVRWRERN